MHISKIGLALPMAIPSKFIQLSKKFFFVIALLFSVLTSVGQAVSISTVVLPPYSPRLGDYSLADINKISITLTNNTQRPLSIKLQLKFFGDNGVRVATKPTYEPTSPIILNPLEVRKLSAADDLSFLDPNNVDINGVNVNQILQTGIIPEGTYTLCAVAYQAYTPSLSTPLSDVNGGCSAPIPVLYVEAPQIVGVSGQLCGAIVPYEPNNLLSFSWNPPAGAKAGIRYKFSLHELMPANRAANDIVFSDPNAAVEEEVNTPVISFSPQQAGLLPGVRYVYRVQAIDPTDQTLFKNGGYSQICSFTMGAADNQNAVVNNNSNYSGEILFPAENDTIPFQNSWIVSKLSPGVRNLSLGSAHVSVTQNRFPVEEVNNTYRNINSNSDSSNFVHRLNQLYANNLHGRELDAAVSFNINISGNANPQDISFNHAFTYGMGTPAVLSIAPNPDSALMLNLRVLPAHAPSRLLPPSIRGLIADINNPGNQWVVNEKMFVEVADNQNFTNARRIKFIPVNYSFDPTRVTEDDIRRNVYAAKNVSVRLPNANSSFLRVGWLSNSSDSNSTAYHYSSALNIAGQVAQTPVRTGVRVGGTIRIGGFTMTIAELSTPQAPFTGIGKINIPFLNQYIKVNFSGITIDSLGNVRSGLANAFNTFNDAVNNLSKEASKTMMQVEETRRRMMDLVRRNLPDTNGLSLPYTFTWGDGNLVTIYKLDFNRDSASVHAYSEIQLPFDEGNEPLKIGLFNAKFTSNCLGADQMRFDVISNHSFALGGGNYLNIAPRGGRNSYANFNCNGFQSASLIGSVRISPEYARTQNNNDTIDINTEINLDQHYESITNLNVPAFVVNRLQDWKFAANNWILDLSSSANHNTMPALINGRRVGADWKGLFIGGLNVITPNWINGGGRNQGISINSQNVMIDENGFTGKITANNIIPFDGSKQWSGWNYGIDSIRIDLRANSVYASSINGKIKTPIHKQNGNALFTIGMVLPEQGNATYNGSLRLGNDIEFSALYATLNISDIVAHVSISDDVNFNLALTGSMQVNAPLPGGTETIGVRMNFREMAIRNTGTTFDLPNVEFENVRIMGYDLGANSMSLSSIPGASPQIRRYTINVNGGLSCEAISFASITGGVNFNFDYNNTNKIFTPQAPSLERCSVRGSFGPLSLNGRLDFYVNDADWGKGLSGRVSCGMDFGTADAVNLTTNFRFGKKAQTEYWYVDGAASGLNVPLFPGVLSLDGLGLGVYSNLSPTQSENNNGLYTYRVQANRFGFNASVSMKSPTPGAYKMKGGIEATFNTSTYAVTNVILSGKLALMGANFPGEGDGNMKFNADIRLHMDLEHGSFQGNANAYLKIGPFIKGSSAGDKVGSIDFSVRRDGYWHIHVGNPAENQFAGTSIGIDPIMLNFRTYYMIGKGIPPMQYPAELIEIIGPENLPAPRPSPEMTMGFAHGASVSFDSGKKKFLIFYGRFRFIVGYDFNVLRYENASCDGQNTRNIGINNWYARGQVYAGAEGSIGLHVDVWFYEGNIEIASIGGAILMEVGLPNPTWMSGKFSGKYRVLGGAVKGRFNFDFTIGDVCRPTIEMENPVANLELIEAMTPENPRAVQKPTVEPEVAMRFVKQNAFTIAVPDGEGNGSVNRTFRANWTINFYQENQQGGNRVPVAYREDINVSEDSFSYIKLIPNAYLAFDKRYVISVTAKMEERVAGRWVTSRRKDGTEIIQTKTSAFRITPVPTIEPYYIEAQYPEPNRTYMYNYVSNGRFKFRQNPEGLFTGTTTKMKSQLTGQVFDFGTAKNVKYLMRYTDLENDQQAYVPLTVYQGNREVPFNLRPLGFDKVYKIEIIRVLRENTFLRDYESSMDRPVFHSSLSIAAAAATAMGNNPVQGLRNLTTTIPSFDYNGNTIEVVRHRQESSMTAEEFLNALFTGMVNSFEDVMYETYVSTSKYQSLRDKMQHTNFGFLAIGNGLTMLGTGDEGLSEEDYADHIGWNQETAGGHPFWAVPTNNNQWFQKAQQFYQSMIVLFNERVLAVDEVEGYGRFSTTPLYRNTPAPRGSYVFNPGYLHIKLFPTFDNSLIHYNGDVRTWRNAIRNNTAIVLSGNKYSYAPHQVLKRDWDRVKAWINELARTNRFPVNLSQDARSKMLWILVNNPPDISEGGNTAWRLDVYPRETNIRLLMPEEPAVPSFSVQPTIR